MDNKVSVRFIIDRKHQFVCLLNKELSFKQVEEYLFSTKPKELFDSENNNNKEEYEGFKFLYSGKLFNYKQTLNDLVSTQPNKLPLNCQLITIKKKQHQEQQHPQSTTTENNSNNTQIEIHFHGCFFDYDEFKQIEEIFNKKMKDSNEKVVHLSFLNQFLHSYWKYLIQRQPHLINTPPINRQGNDDNNNNPNSSFPNEKLSNILRNVLKVPSLNSETTINKEQFRIIFFLFTSNSETSICPNGTHESVLKMIEQYHPTIDETHSFNINEFNKLFNLVLSVQPPPPPTTTTTTSDAEQTQPPQLSCKNIELLFYLYTANIVMMREEKQNKNSNDNAKNVSIPSL